MTVNQIHKSLIKPAIILVDKPRRDDLSDKKKEGEKETSHLLPRSRSHYEIFSASSRLSLQEKKEITHSCPADYELSDYETFVTSRPSPLLKVPSAVRSACLLPYLSSKQVASISITCRDLYLDVQKERENRRDVFSQTLRNIYNTDLSRVSRFFRNSTMNWLLNYDLNFAKSIHYHNRPLYHLNFQPISPNLSRQQRVLQQIVDLVNQEGFFNSVQASSNWKPLLDRCCCNCDHVEYWDRRHLFCGMFSFGICGAAAGAITYCGVANSCSCASPCWWPAMSGALGGICLPASYVLACTKIPISRSLKRLRAISNSQIPPRLLLPPPPSPPRPPSNRAYYNVPH